MEAKGPVRLPTEAVWSASSQYFLAEACNMYRTMRLQTSQLVPEISESWIETASLN